MHCTGSFNVCRKDAIEPEKHTAPVRASAATSAPRKRTVADDDIHWIRHGRLLVDVAVSLARYLGRGEGMASPPPYFTGSAVASQ